MTIAPKTEVHICGAGTGGSYVARDVLKHIRDYDFVVHAYDDQDVDESNARAQAYEPEHIGMPKVEALAFESRKWNREVIPHKYRLQGTEQLSGVVFNCVDSMNGRWDIWANSVRRKPVDLMIEMRLDRDSSYIFVVDPNNETHIRKWERYWYPNDESTTAGMSCGAVTSLGPIAPLTASLCAWQLVRWLQIRDGAADTLDNQIRSFMVPLRIESFKW